MIFLNIAITGATGLVGTELVRYLKKDTKYHLKCISREAKEYYIYSDYSISSLVDIFKDVDLVIHLAAARGRNGRSGYADYLVNEKITSNILEAMKISNVPRIIYLSSISVYSDESIIPWKENSATNPASFYGLSKLFGEILCNHYKQEGVDSLILRCAHILAYEESPYMLSNFLRRASQQATIYVNGKSISRREFIYLKDVVRAIKYGIDDRSLNGTYNLGSGKGVTNYELASLINDAFDNNGNIIYNANSDEGIKSSIMNSDKIKENGFFIKYSYEEALRDLRRDRFNNNV